MTQAGRIGFLGAAVFSVLAMAQGGMTVQIPLPASRQEAPGGRGAPGAAGTQEAQPGQPAPAAARGGRGTAPPAVQSTSVSPRDLKYPPLRSIQAPEIATFTLRNGMKLLLLEDHELPVINGLAAVHAGTLLDPPERIGLAAAAGTLLRAGGTAAKTPDQVDNLLDSMAATIDSSADETSTKVSFSCLKENFGTVSGMFREVLTQPEFRQEKLDTVRAQMRAAIANRNDDPGTIAQRELASLIYGRDNPYGWVAQYATVDRITRGDLRAYHARYFFPANTTIGIWGDFDSEQMKAAIEKEFAGWTVPPQPAPEFPKWSETSAAGIYLAEKKEATQTAFAIGHAGGKADDKDLAALQVMAAILGTGPKGRIPEKARGRTGAVHDIRVLWLAPYDRPGLFEVVGSTGNVGAVDVIRGIREEIQRIASTEVTEQELTTARDLLLNRFVFAYDSRAKLLGRQMLFDFYRYPKDYLPQYQKALQAVTRADVLRVANQHLSADKLAIVAVTNPSSFAEPLDKLGGPVNPLDLTIPEQRVEPVITTDASLAEGKALLQKAQTALGGVQKLLAVKDLLETAAYQIDSAVPNMGGAKVTETDRWIAPAAFRQESVLPAGRVAAFTDGRVGWIATPQGWGALAGTQLKQVQSDLFRTWFRLMLSDLVEGRTVNAVDGSSVQITDPVGQGCKVEFDPNTGLPRRITYDTPQAIGPPLYTEDVLEDYRDVDGVKLPFKMTINQSGRKFADVTVTEYKLNSGLKFADLSRRPN
jgi:predicted Zn-dependent peptidase